MRVDYEITPELIKESQASLPAGWDRAFRFRFISTAVIALAFASGVLVWLGLMGPLIVSWGITAALFGWLFFRGLQISQPLGLEESVRQYVEISPRCLTLGDKHTVCHHHWGTVGEAAQSASLIYILLGPAGKLITLPKSVFASPAEADRFLTEVHKHIRIARKSRGPLAPASSKARLLFEIEFPVSDPAGRSVSLSFLAAMILLGCLFLYLSTLSRAWGYLAGPAAFLLVALLAGRLASLAWKMVVYRNVPLAKRRTFQLTEKGVYEYDAVYEQITTWEGVGEVLSYERSFQLFNDKGFHLQDIPTNAFADEAAIDEFLQIIEKRTSHSSGKGKPDSSLSTLPSPQEEEWDEETEVAPGKQSFASSALGGILGTLGFLALFLGLLAGWSYALSAMAGQWQAFPDTVLLAAPSLGYWVLIAILLSACCCALLLYLGWRLFYAGPLGSKIPYGGEGAGYWRVQFVIALICLLGSLALVLPGLDWYTRVTPQGLAVNNYWSIGETIYNFDDVKMIKDVSFSHQGRDIPAYTVQFKSGASWSSQGPIKDVNPAQTKIHRQLAEYISQQSGVRIKK